jgi:pimeloyl-ACP methyl ester carboxylesterase
MITANQMARSVLFRPFVADPARVDPAVLYDALEDNGGINVLRALCLARQLDFEELMKAARVPVALIWGSRDLLLRESDCVRTSELMHVVGTAELPGIGHWPMLEAPADLGRLLSGSLESVHYPIAAEK